jgi:hypothetical protein
MKKIIVIVFTILITILTACESPLNDKYLFDNPIKCFNWISENFDSEVVGYVSPTQTLETRKGDCYTLSLLFCEMMQDYEYTPEIVSGPWNSNEWHTVAKINNTYFDLSFRKIYTENPFPNYSISMPWRMAKGYQWYADFVE